MNIRIWLQLLVIASVACGFVACGNKGKLKSPTQIEEAEAKKEKKKGKEAKEVPTGSQSMPETPLPAVPAETK